jgi:molybdate transport system substrate-binding protein
MKISMLMLAAMSLAAALPASAAELKVLAGGSMAGTLKELGPRFEKATGHKLDIHFAGTPELIKTATSGAPFDLGVVPDAVMKNAEARAKFAPATPVNIARVGYGVAAKAGAPKPDISTPEKFKDAMLKAQSIALYPASAAGAFVLKTFEKLGIESEMKAKMKAQASPSTIPQVVASGEAQYGVFLTNVLIGSGVEPVGPFPGNLQSELAFVGGVAAESKNAAAAKAFIDYLQTPEAIAVIKAKGLTPG